MAALFEKFPLGFQWRTQDPFLFCVHHLDAYPSGTDDFGLKPDLLRGRPLGQDFEPRDGFRMYHGETVPGFPVHPHRGFETVTIVRQGYVDHADSMGAAGRYGGGDVQWMTAGKGVQHSEMFPLLRQDAPNPAELFQIWINLPAARKTSEPDFKMLWSERIPVLEKGGARVTVVAGAVAGIEPLEPPRASWASEPGNETAIWLIRLEPEAELELPPASGAPARSLYFFEGSEVDCGSETLSARTGAFLDARQPLTLRARGATAELLLLQGKPIAEPIAQYGPFVMNTEAQIHQTFQEYRRTQFGGWPWPRPDMVHGPWKGRFAKYPDGRTEKP